MPALSATASGDPALFCSKSEHHISALSSVLSKGASSILLAASVAVTQVASVCTLSRRLVGAFDLVVIASVKSVTVKQLVRKGS